MPSPSWWCSSIAAGVRWRTITYTALYCRFRAIKALNFIVCTMNSSGSSGRRAMAAVQAGAVPDLLYHAQTGSHPAATSGDKCISAAAMGTLFNILASLPAQQIVKLPELQECMQLMVQQMRHGAKVSLLPAHVAAEMVQHAGSHQEVLQALVDARALVPLLKLAQDIAAWVTSSGPGASSSASSSSPGASSSSTSSSSSTARPTAGGSGRQWTVTEALRERSVLVLLAAMCISSEDSAQLIQRADGLDIVAALLSPMHPTPHGPAAVGLLEALLAQMWPDQQLAQRAAAAGLMAPVLKVAQEAGGVSIVRSLECATYMVEAAQCRQEIEAAAGPPGYGRRCSAAGHALLQQPLRA